MEIIFFSISLLSVLFFKITTAAAQGVSVTNWHELNLITEANKSVFMAPICDFKQ